MKSIFLLDADLSLFDGEGGGASASGAMGESSTAQDSTQPANSVDTRTDDGEAKAEPTTEEKRKAYNDLIRGEYKDFYTEDTQKLIDRRFKETKNLEKELQGNRDIMDMLMLRYGVKDTSELQKAIEDDDSYWESAAMEAGMSVEQFKQFQKLERENKALLKAQQERQREEQVNRQLDTWYRDAEQIKKTYADFSLENEIQNPDFMRLLKANVPMEHAYKLIHMDEMMDRAVTASAADAEKRTVDNIRARGMRPAENGTSSQSSFKTKGDVHALTKEERAELIKRAARGEIVSF